MRSLFFFLFFLGLQSGLFAQKYSSGPQVLSFHSLVDGTDQPYALYLPKNFSEKKAYPFVVMLHGAGSNHRLALRRVFGKSNAEGENDVDASLYFPEWENQPYIVAAPLARGTMGYQGVAESDVWDMVADVKRRFKIDEDRTYLTGLSMGGGGTLWIGLTRPDFWAAIAPVCPAAPEGTEAYLPNAKHLPTRFFHGDADPVVSLASVNHWVEGFRKAGAEVKYDVFPGVKHDSWVPAYADGQVFDWFSGYKRNSSPQEVIFSTASLKHNRSFWMEIVGISPGKVAKIEAQLRPGNKVEVKAEQVEAFRIHPSKHLKEGATFTLVLNGTETGKHKVGDQIILPGQPDTYRKTPSLSGPMADISSARHIYVYGTADQPSQEELAKRRKLAEIAADWSFYRGEFLGRVMVFPRVLADRELSANDLKNSDLVLFGTDKTNSAIAKLTLPFRFVEGLSVSYIYPGEHRRVLINSGEPFWEIKDKGNPNLRILRSPSKAGVLAGYGDWMVQKNGEVTWGYFDSNWKVRAEDEAKLKGLGLR